LVVCFNVFHIGSYIFVWFGLEWWIFYFCLPCIWDDRHTPL
jgi:hypothetical protein